MALEKLSLPKFLKPMAPFLKAGWEAVRAKGSLKEKFGVFLKALQKEMMVILTAKEEVTDETEKEAVAAIKSTKHEDIKKAVGISEEDLETDEAKEVHERFTATITAALHKHSKLGPDAKVALGKIQEGERLTLDESRAIAAIGLETLLSLKNHEAYRGKPEEFRKMLEQVFENHGKSAYKLRQVFTVSHLKLLKPDIKTDIAEIAGGLASDLLSGNLKDNDAAKLNAIAMKLDIPLAESEKMGATLLMLGEKGMKDDAEKVGQVADIFGKYLLKKTSESNVKRVVKLINEIITGTTGEIGTDKITDFIYLTDNADIERFIEVLS